ncbi:MAG: hypothetical protein KBC38_03185 [Candidatus Pacebacteria bacterium]|nr:hypothetical protein [Candidatus Paceibacterota bacterium]MBP9840585.1 hypothetical protein [Candidatus Paceibacterota bacterium]
MTDKSPFERIHEVLRKPLDAITSEDRAAVARFLETEDPRVQRHPADAACPGIIDRIAEPMRRFAAGKDVDIDDMVVAIAFFAHRAYKEVEEPPPTKH